MPEISNQMNLVDSTPQEAAQNINNANIFNIGADVFKEQKVDLQPTVDQLARPKDATPAVTDFVSVNKEYAALAAPDVDMLSQAEVRVRQMGAAIKGEDLDRELSQLQFKKENQKEKFSQDDELRMFVLGEQQKEARQFKIDEPGKNDQLINKALESNKETSMLGDFSNALKKGFADLNAGVAKTPELLYDLYFYPANLVRQARGEELIETPEGLAENPIVQRYNEASQFFGSQVPQLNKSISEAVASGDFAEAGKIAALQFTANAPNQMALILAGATGFGGLGLGVAGTTTAAQSNYENQKNGINAVQSLPNAVAKGGIEASFENLGTLGAFKSWESALTKSFGKQNATKVVQNTLKSILYSGASEGNEEFLTSVAQDLTDYITGVNPEALKGIWGRAVDAGALGGLSGAGMTAPSALASAAIKSKSDITVPEKPGTARAIESLQLDTDLSAIVKKLKETEMSKIAPAQIAEVTKGMLNKAGLDYLFIDKEDATKWANSKQKALDFRNIIDPSGEAAAALNAPMQIEAHKFMELAVKYPEVTEIVKKSPEAANAEKAKAYLEKVEKANKQKEEVLGKLGSSKINEEERAQLEATLGGIKIDQEIFGEEDYLDQSNIEEAAANFVPEMELERFLEADRNAKMEVVTNINETAQYEMDKVKDIMTEIATETQLEQELVKLKDDPNLDIVDKFYDSKNFFPTERYRTLAEATAPHAKEGFSAFAIDPRTLTPKQKERYAKDKQLRKHKVFVKGGISANDAARLIGVNGGENLLKILSQTPTRQEVAETQTKIREKEIADEVNRNVDLNNTGIVKAYAARLNNAMTTLKYMKDKEWPALKGAIKRIAMTPPKISEIISEAKTYIAQTQVGKLDANQFKVGERKSRKMAMDAILKNEPEEAYKNQSAVASNIALANETQLAIARVNRVIQFAKRFNKKEIQQLLKDAGPLYENAANELLDTFNLDPRKKGISEQGSFLKWVKEMAETGEGTFEIPDRFQDVQEDFRNLTVEQVILVGDRLREILYKARFKNKLYKKHSNIKAMQTIQGFANHLRQQAQQIPGYDLSKNDAKVDSAVTETEKFFKTRIDEGQNYLERPQYIISKLDRGNVTGPYNDLFYRPFVEADAAAKQLVSETQKHLEKVIEKFGTKDFENLASEFVDVPEFEKVKNFKNGRVSKAELLVMEFNFGNEGNIEALERFGVDRDTLRKVLDRELQDRHTALAQDIWNIFETFKPKIGELQKRTEGTDVNWVQARSFEARGKVYPGGYYPIHLADVTTNIIRKNLQGAAETNRLDKFLQKYYAQTMTDQGHLEARTGSDKTVRLSMNKLSQSLDQVIHDLTHREAIRDTIKLLADKTISEDIVAVVGIPGYRNIANMVIDSAEGLEKKGYEADEFAAGFLRQLGGGVQTVAIAGKITSIAIQPASILVAANRMGNISAAKYLGKAAAKIASNPRLFGEFMAFAEDIHPALKASREDLEGQAVFAFDKMLPEKKIPIVGPVIAARDFVNEWAFKLLGLVDRLNKTIVATAAYMQAIDGEAQGVEKGNHVEAKKYASNLVELTQTSNEIRNLSPVQKNKWLKWTTYFYSDLNNIYNNTLHVARTAKQNFESSGTAAAKGDWKLAQKAGAEGIGGILSMMMTFTLAKTYEAVVRGGETPFDGGGSDDPDEFLDEVAKWFLTSPLEFFDTIPLSRDVKFATGKFWEKKKTVDMPIDSALGSFATSIAGMKALFDADKTVTKREKREMLISLGIITKLPTGALYNYFVKPDFEITPVIDDSLGKLSKSIDGYLKRNEGEIPEELLKEIETFKSDIDPQADIEVPTDTNSVIKQVVSQGNPFAYNADTGAAGAYQFTETQWNAIRQENPDLGLTENGREESPEQQERAMDYQTGKNAVMLQVAGIQSNADTLLAAHILGTDKAIEILQAKDDAKLKTLVDENFMKVNQFKNSMRIKEFKVWLNQKTTEARDQLIPR